MNDPRDPLAHRTPLPTAGDEPAATDSAETPNDGAPRLFKLLQGYIWHPIDLEIDLGEWLPATIEPDIHLLWDPLERAPFTFFDDGTLAETQRLYQFTAVRLDPGDDPERIVPWLAETIQRKLETTPEGVGWQVMEDLREIV